MKMDDRITIIHAPNGFGKTAILRMVDGLFNSRYSELRAFPFKAFGVEFDDGRVLTVTKRRIPGGALFDDAQRPHRDALTFLADGHTPYERKPAREKEARHFPVEAIEHEVPGVVRIAEDLWRTPNGDTLEADELFERYSDFFPFRVPDSKEEPQWFRDFKSGVDVRFIRTDRLIAFPDLRPRRSGRPVATPTVMSYSDELAFEIKSTLAKYAELSQRLDRTFPSRLVSQAAMADMTKLQVSEQIEAFEAKRSRLVDAGLLDKERDDQFHVPQAIDDSKLGVLAVYVGDVEEKLGVFESLASKIDLFKSIINERFHHKQMTISKDRGITWHVSCGHDILELLSFAMRSVFGAHRAVEVGREQLERGLRLAYESAYFAATTLYADIRSWEERNVGYTILPNALTSSD
jgi:hypothetical protein